MKQKMINQETIEGRVYQHNLAIKNVQNTASANFGKSYISGTLDIATDEDGMNVLSVHYTYVSPVTKTGTPSPTYTALERIINDGKTWLVDGKDAATKVKATPSLAVDDWYGQDGNLVTTPQNESGFLSIVNDLGAEANRNTFSVDTILTSMKKVEPENEDEKSYAILRGAVFNFKNDLMPVEFTVRNPAGISYFEEAEITNSTPLFTKVWGKIVSTTITKERVEESAFGEAAVKTSQRKSREWLVTGTSKVPYDFGDPEAITQEELVKAMQDREVHLAEVKKSHDDYVASKQAGTPTGFANGTMNAPQSTVKRGTFNF